MTQAAREKPGFSGRDVAVAMFLVLMLVVLVVLVGSLVGPISGIPVQKARATQDCNSLKQLGLGTIQYLNDNDDRMFGEGGSPAWPQVFHEKYLTDWHEYQSPFDKRIHVKDPNAPANVSYGFNVNVLTPTPKGVPGSYEGSTTQWVSPSELIIMTTAPDPSTKLSFSGTSVAPKTVQPPTGPPAGTYSSRNQINVLYGDGHSSHLGWQNYSDSSSPHKGLSRWWPLGYKPKNGADPK